MKDYLVSINLYKIKNDDKILLNNSGLPILFYWNGEDSIIESIKNSESFNNLIEQTCFNIENYSSSKLSYFKYEIDSENYEEETYDIQEIFSNKIEDFYIDYVLDIFYNLYELSFKKQYGIKTYTNADIKNIYIEIENSYKDKFSTASAINYVRSQLEKKYKLSKSNINFIINQLSNII